MVHLSVPGVDVEETSMAATGAILGSFSLVALDGDHCTSSFSSEAALVDGLHRKNITLSN